MGAITIRLTEVQAKVLWNTIDGAMDAGACADGNTRKEAAAMDQIMQKLLPHHKKFMVVDLT